MKLDRVKLERRRLQAARLLPQGVYEAEVARRVGVHRQSVNRWARQLAQGGRQALKRAPRAGRPPTHPGVAARLGARTPSGGTYLGLPQKTRIAQPLPAPAVGAECHRPRGLAKDASPAHLADGVLETGRIVLTVTILCNSR